MTTIVAIKSVDTTTGATPNANKSTATTAISSASSTTNYTISPPSTVSSSPILFYQQNSPSPTISSNESLDTIKSSSSTIKQQQQQQQQQPKQQPMSITLVQPQPMSISTTVHISIKPPSPSPQASSSSSSSSSQLTSQPKKKKLLNIPNYYVPPKNNYTLSSTSLSSSSSSPSIDTQQRPQQQQTQPPPPSSLSSSSQSSSSQSSLSLSSSKPQPPKLVRKKSGELVKSSLRLNRSSLLQRSLSSPNFISNNHNSNGSESPRKSVRFASRLTNVKMFDEMESPASVSSRNSPCDSPPNELSSVTINRRRRTRRGATDLNGRPILSDLDDLLDVAREDYDFEMLMKMNSKPKNFQTDSRNKNHFDWNWSTSSSSDEENEQDEEEEDEGREEEAKGYVREYRLLKHNLPKYRSFNGNDDKIWISSAYLLKSSDKTHLCGFIQVQNLAYEKDLMLKMTLDDWKTSFRFGGKSIISFVKSIDNHIDEFKFMINLKDIEDVNGSSGKQVQHLQNGNDNVSVIKRRLQLCVRYQVAGCEYWANNSGNNYVFEINEILRKPFTIKSSGDGVHGIQFRRKSMGSAASTASMEEVCSKLLQHQQNTTLGHLNLKMNELSLFNNFQESISTTTTTTNVNITNTMTNKNSTTPASRRPLLNKSYSLNDICGNNFKYSNLQSTMDHRNLIGGGGGGGEEKGALYADIDYTDLVKKFCFANSNSNIHLQSGNKTNKVSAGIGRSMSPSGNGGCAVAQSVASTFQHFSDSSIHI
ncbi:hypothetical protein KGF56_002107 [Candida oxycetoniae]|uniref:CBM21 domain-containing protein n=1 Tax=Candida oxycetoniae TaxID=497107 RepID=A0AAI9WYS6_9ASCO|nr:uncharacterized protein KGF56_002107 [Candida oxycetoniae]KAI3405151.2 hypothetical protein KGF56_002107 [Candida oxycetoniae]